VICPPAGFLRPTPRPSCRRRARTRTCAPRAPRHQRARGSSRRRTPGPARPGICTPCAGSSSDLQSGSPTVDLPLGARCMPPARCVNLSGVTWVGPLVCSPATSEPTGVVDAANVPSRAPGPSSLGTRAAGPGIARRPRDRTVSIEEDAGACQSPSAGNSGSASISRSRSPHRWLRRNLKTRWRRDSGLLPRSFRQRLLRSNQDISANSAPGAFGSMPLMCQDATSAKLIPTNPKSPMPRSLATTRKVTLLRPDVCANRPRQIADGSLLVKLPLVLVAARVPQSDMGHANTSSDGPAPAAPDALDLSLNARPGLHSRGFSMEGWNRKKRPAETFEEMEAGLRARLKALPPAARRRAAPRRGPPPRTLPRRQRRHGHTGSSRAVSLRSMSSSTTYG